MHIHPHPTKKLLVLMTDLFYLIAFVSPSNSDDKGGKKEYHIQGLTRSFQWRGDEGLDLCIEVLVALFL